MDHDILAKMNFAKMRARQTPSLIQTAYSELIEQLESAPAAPRYPLNGSMASQSKGDKTYWYYMGYSLVSGARKREYVGPAGDPETDEKVAAFNKAKEAWRRRIELVRMLDSYGLPKLDATSAAIIDSIARSGFFNMRGVIVGSLAFQTYAGLLGRKSVLFGERTTDVDFAQFHSVAINLSGRVEPEIYDQLRAIDKTFEPISTIRSEAASAFKNAAGFKVEFLTPNRGSDEHQDRLATMPTFGNVKAQPLRFLDFLIHDPVHAALLYRDGVLVSVPQPERYAIHKLIVATRRDATRPDKIRKDISQAGMLIGIYAEDGRGYRLWQCWKEAWDRGPAWRKALKQGAGMLEDDAHQALTQLLHEGAAEDGLDFDQYGLDISASQSRMTPR